MVECVRHNISSETRGSQYQRSIAPCGAKLIVEPLPLSEGGGVDHDNGVLDEGLGPDQLVVASVVDNVDDPGLAGSGLGGPGKVASVEPDILQLKSKQ